MELHRWALCSWDSDKLKIFNKLWLFALIFLALPLGSSALCQGINPITNVPCDIITPVIYCSSNAYILNLNSSINYSYPMTSMGDGTYKIVFNNGIGEYSVILCDNSTTTFSVVSASGTTPTYYPTTQLSSTGTKTNYRNLNYSIDVQVSQYPYVDINQSTTFFLDVLLNGTAYGNLTNTLIIREQNMSNSTINIPYDNLNKNYHVSLFFDGVGNYPFTINTNGTGINTTIASGTLIVRQPFYVYVKLFNDNDLTEYRNNYGFITAEFESAKYIDTGLEPFFYAIKDRSTKNPVFHANYIDGTARLKLFENNTKYTYRFMDSVTFNSSYDKPDKQKISAVQMYLGTMTTNSTTTYQFVLTNKDKYPYAWLFNTIFFILLGMSIVVGVFLFFLIPDKPQIALVFTIIIAVGSILLRIGVWLYFGV